MERGCSLELRRRDDRTDGRPAAGDRQGPRTDPATVTRRAPPEQNGARRRWRCSPTCRSCCPRPGRVSADSKQYLYLDPARSWPGRSTSGIRPIGAGTVPHQHLGYLVPGRPVSLGPRPARACPTGSPSGCGWDADVRWPPLGARWLFRELGTGRAGALAGALVYCLTPYQLAFTARISVLLLPWAALPWLVGLTARGHRARATGGRPRLGARPRADRRHQRVVAAARRRWPAALGGRGGGSRSGAGRGGPLRATGRVAVLALGVSVWWLVGVRLQGALRAPGAAAHREPADGRRARRCPATCSAASATGSSTGGTRPASPLDQAAAYDSERPRGRAQLRRPRAWGWSRRCCVRWAHRTYFVLLIVVGVGGRRRVLAPRRPVAVRIGVGALHATRSLGLAFRNSPRAVPLVVLGFAGLLAAAVGSLPRVPWRRVGGGAVAVLALGALVPCGTGRLPLRRRRPTRGHPGLLARPPGTTSTPATTRRGSSSCPAPPSPPTAGGTSSTRSPPASPTGPTSRARSCRTAPCRR